MQSLWQSRVLSVAAGFVLAGMIGCGQSSTSSDSARTADDAPTRADEARARLSGSDGGRMVLRAIDAHGGLEAWYSAPTSSYAWEYSNFGSNLRFKTRLVADNRSRRIYHDIVELGTPEKVEAAEGRMAWDGQQAWIWPAGITSVNPRFWAATGYYFESMPFVFADPGVNFKVFPPEALDSIPHDRVMAYFDVGVGDTPGDTYTLYLNQDTGMVDAVLYTVTYGRAYTPSEAGPPPPTRGNLFYYQDYATVDGLTVPTRFRGFSYADGEKGDMRNEAWASEFSFRAPFDESKLAMPPDGRIQPYEVRQPER